MRQPLWLEGGDTAASGKVFLAKLYPLRARGPSPLDLIAQPLLFSSYIPDFSQERGNNLRVPAMATPAACAISFNHHDTEVSLPLWRSGNGGTGRRGRSGAGVQMRTFPPLKRTVPPSRHTAWEHTAAPATEVQTNSVFLAERNHKQAPSPHG